MLAPPTLPLISVVLITYNGERHLREQIESILSQTYKNIELVISDDHSGDKTVEILESYLPDPRIKLTLNNKNLGFRKNFEIACQQASGELIAPADQDDIWLPEKLKKLQQAIDENMLAYSNSRLMTEDGRLFDSDLGQHHNIRFVDGHCPRAFYLGNCIAAHTVLFRREILQYLSPTPETLFHDQWLGFIAATMGSIKFVDQELVQYRQNPDSVTGKAGTSEHQSLRQRIREKHLRQTQRIDNKVLYLKRMLELQTELGRKDGLLENLIQQYQLHDNYIFNRKLYQLLMKNSQELFTTYQKKPERLAAREAAGNWLYKWLAHK